MTDLDIAISKLDKVKKTSNGYDARCPCHNDQHASLSLSEDNGKLLAYCHAGCSFEKIIKALDLPSHKDNSTSTITATYDYTDAQGNLIYQVVRYHPKAFRQRRPNGEGGWIWNLEGITPTLYHLPEIIQAIKDNKMVWVVEGEKDADNLRHEGRIATTISGGVATKWHPSLIPLFFNATVAIIPDADEPGRKYAQYVANLLYGITSSLKIVELPIELAVKDVSDYLETETIDNLEQLAYTTNEYIPAGVVTREEFNELRGLNIYLLRHSMRVPPHTPPTSTYTNTYIYNTIRIEDDE